MLDIEFFFDCSSPWTYLAFHNIQPLAREFSATIRWRPILVGGVFNAINPSVYEWRSKPVQAKQAYAERSLAAWARWSGVSMRTRPTVFPVNSVKVMRACLVVEPQGRLPDFAQAAFEAYWRDDRDISQDSVVRDLCASCGVAHEAVLSAIATPQIKDALRANTSELVARGGFGSPTMFVHGDDMYFGNDHMPLVRCALEGSRRDA